RALRGDAVQRGAQGDGAPGRVDRRAEGRRRQERDEHAAHERHREGAPGRDDDRRGRPRHDGRLSMSEEYTAQQPEPLKYNLQQLLRAMVEKGASDMHITAGSPPVLRIDGDIVPLKLPPLSKADTKSLCYEMLTEDQRAKFETTNELDLSFPLRNVSRFR